MNYRHSFHAGNFADLVKHSILLWLLDERRARGAVSVIDTHGGAGVYDLSGDAARSKEAEAGVARLMAAHDLPPVLDALAAEVRAINAPDEVRFYPGSPLLVARRSRAGDGHTVFELNPPVAALLREAMAPWPHVRVVEGDGYPAAAKGPRGGLALIDPPFEKPDDYVRSAEAAMAAARAGQVVAVWTPIKDMETFDGFLRRLSGSVLVAEARLRPLTNPMKMNGCAMVVLNPPAGLEAAANQVCGWAAAELGDPGARAEVWSL